VKGEKKTIKEAEMIEKITAIKVQKGGKDGQKWTFPSSS